MRGGWWTTVSFGGALVTAYRTDWPRGPWRSREAAEAAMGRWRTRVGSLAGTIMAAHSVRLVGPFPTRDAARGVDVSDWPEHVEPEAVR